MPVDSNTTSQPGPPSLWFGIGRFLFVVILVVVIFLLGPSMVRHRFFRGGWVNRNGTVRP